jgi:hypothetical protein
LPVTVTVAPGSGAGTYRLDVDGVSLEGYAFDSAHSVLSREVTVGASAAVVGAGPLLVAAALSQFW